MSPVLEIEDLCKTYPGFALRNVSFQVPAGTIMGLIGPNGAGKTTIIKLIMNLIRKDAGEIRVFGQDHLAAERAVKARIGFVYDMPAFHHDAPLRTIAAAVAPFYPAWNDGLFRTLLAEFELPPRMKFKKLSHGMQTKFALALALAHDADLILMDEPTAGLDPIFRRDLLGRLSGILQDERKSILFSTHITTDLERIADAITFLRNGEVVFSAPKDEILEQWGVVRGGKELLDEDTRRLFEGVQVREYGFEALTSRREEARRRLDGRAVVEKASLEDIMVLLAERRNHAA